MKKYIIAIIIGFFVVSSTLKAPESFAADEDASVQPTGSPAVAAEKAAYTASMLGVNRLVIEGVIFGTAVALMAVAISSGTDSAHGQVSGHGSGNANGH